MSESANKANELDAEKAEKGLITRLITLHQPLDAQLKDDYPIESDDVMVEPDDSCKKELIQGNRKPCSVMLNKIEISTSVSNHVR